MTKKRTELYCRNDSKRYCMRCKYYWRCDKANRCNGNCYACDDFDCENNLKVAKGG